MSMITTEIYSLHYEYRCSLLFHLGEPDWWHSTNML